jgi:hypothetical protein
MVDQTGRRQIAITIAKAAPRSASEPQYVYHWNRIIAASAALILTISLLGYGLYAWWRPSHQPAKVEVEKVQQQDAIVVETARQPEGAVNRPMSSPSQPTPETAAAKREAGAVSSAIDSESANRDSDHLPPPVPPQPRFEEPTEQRAGEAVSLDPPRPHDAEPLHAEVAEGALAHAVVGETIANPPLIPTNDGQVVAEAVPAQAPVSELREEESRLGEQGPIGGDRPASAPEDDADTPIVSAKAPAPETQPGETAEVTDTADEQSGKGHFRPLGTSISSAAVKRFVLAQSVAGNEPRGRIEDITLSSKGDALVCSFSEVIGLEGEVLEYHWLYEGKEVLRIPVPVAAERWRSHSTKRIYQRMTGTWRVELRDSGGTLLASAGFVF